MLIEIQPGDTRPIYLQIMDEIRRGVVVGTLKKDEGLPSVRELAADLRVNPNTVQQAYRELERQGVVFVRRGQGTFIARDRISGVDRRSLAENVAGRALRDAFRHGLSMEDLIGAIRRAGSRRRQPGSAVSTGEKK